MQLAGFTFKDICNYVLLQQCNFLASVIFVGIFVDNCS